MATSLEFFGDRQDLQAPFHSWGTDCSLKAPSYLATWFSPAQELRMWSPRRLISVSLPEATCTER